ncbi:hypothetical protein [Consotaella salsifontis]|uniref:hypothetical protein n=1 Tax=Consotaella salsifontis TaxID=1365950 RepID=UPI00105494F5|nr:hypothetical protein [Consotaella salsifontis]
MTALSVTLMLIKAGLRRVILIADLNNDKLYGYGNRASSPARATVSQVWRIWEIGWTPWRLGNGMGRYAHAVHLMRRCRRRAQRGTSSERACEI